MFFELFNIDFKSRIIKVYFDEVFILVDFFFVSFVDVKVFEKVCDIKYIDICDWNWLGVNNIWILLEM